MSLKIKRLISVLMTVVLVVIISCFSVPGNAATKQQLENEKARLQKEASAIQKEINELKSKQADQQAVVSAYQRQIANTQAQINSCNAEIQKMNNRISANKKTIENKQNDIDKDVLEFKKRIRAIYMSDFDSNIKILLGADDFSEFLQLSQLTASISAKDKKMIEKLAAEIETLNNLNAENQKLIDNQVSIRATIQAKQDELEAQERAAAAVLNSIAAEKNKTQSDKDAIDKQIKNVQRQQAALEESIRRAAAEAARGNSGTFSGQVQFNPSSSFKWPVSGYRNISAGFQSNDSVHRGHHNGIDISGGGIQGQPIRAIADGVVTTVSNGCSHNYKKSGNCCGNGYGNYAVINHGNIGGSSYSAWYAHAERITVSPGSLVKQGDVIGYVGTTGFSTGYHLHLGVMRNGNWINPLSVF